MAYSPLLCICNFVASLAYAVMLQLIVVSKPESYLYSASKANTGS